MSASKPRRRATAPRAAPRPHANSAVSAAAASDDDDDDDMSPLAKRKKTVKGVRRWAEEANVAGHGTFENLRVDQIICNTGRSLSKAKKTKCTDVGSTMANNLIELVAKGMFTSPAQVVAAIISNAIDACSKGPAIGRFGVGFFSIFYFLGELGNNLQVVTKSSKSPYEYSLSVKPQDGRLVASLSRVKTERSPGTTVTVQENRGFQVNLTSMVETVSTFDQCTGAAIMFRGKKVNPKGNFLNGTIEVKLENHSFSVSDTGIGMSLKEVQKLLMPRLPNEQMLASPSVSDEPEVEVVHDPELVENFFGIYVNRVLVKAVKFKGLEQGLNSRIFLPAATRLPSSRDDVLLSDARTFALLKMAITRLIALHADLGSVVSLRKFVCEYAKQSGKAFRLVQHFDRAVVESGFLLAPPNDKLVAFLGRHLKLKTVASDVFNSMKLEDTLLEEARGKVDIDDKLLKNRLVLYIAMVEHDYLISPHLSRIVVFRPDITVESISNFYNVDQHLSRGKVVFDIDKLIKRKYGSLTPTEIIHDHRMQIQKTLFAHHVAFLPGDRVNRIFPNFLDLCRFIKIGDADFLEFLSCFQSKLVTCQIRAAPYGVENFRFNVHDLVFTNETKCRFATLEHPSIKRLELSLIAFKLSLYPTLPGGELVVCFFGNKSKTSSFTELVAFLIEETSSQFIVTKIIEAVEKHTEHVVEAFLVVFIFCEFVFDAKSKKMTLDATFCNYCVLHFITSIRKTAKLETLIMLFTRAIAGAEHDAQVLRVIVIDPVMASFDVLHGKRDDGFERTHEIAMDVIAKPRGVEIVKHAFTINDMMTFAFDGGFHNRRDFMLPATLDELEESAMKHRGVVSTQAVAIDVNFETTLDPITDAMRELFEHAVNIQHGAEEQRTIHIGVDLQHICTFVSVGIQEDNIMDMLLPLVSFEPDKGRIGGSDFLFAAMRLHTCDHVVITTCTGNFWCEIVARPVLEGDLVVDVAVRMESGKPVGERREGTYVQLITKDAADQTETAAQAMLEVESMYGFGSTSVLLNQKSISIKLEPLFDLPGVLSIAVFTIETTKPSVVLVDGLPHAQLMPFWESFFTPDDADRVWLSLFYTNVVISIAHEQVQLRRRGKIRFKDTEQVKTALQQAALWWKIYMYGMWYSGNAFRNAIVPRSNADFFISQSTVKFTTKWSGKQFPESIEDFRRGISTVALAVSRRCAKENGDKMSEYQHAEAYLAKVQILPIYKQALLRWFKTKTFRCEHPPKRKLPDDKKEPLSTAAAPLSDEVDPDVALITAFVSAFFECINIALSKGHKIFTPETNTEITPLQAVPMVVRVNRPVPAAAAYIPSRHRIEIYPSGSKSEICAGVLSECRRLKNNDDLTPEAKADHLLEFLKQSNNTLFFHTRGSGEGGTILHETFHAYNKNPDESGHPSLLLVDKDSGPVNTDGTYESGIIAMCKWVIDAGFAQNIWGKIFELV